MTDPYASYASSPNSPARRAFAVTLDEDFALVPTAIYVGSGGHVSLVPLDTGSPVVYKNVPSGAYLTVRASRVNSAGTTAADLVGEV